MRRREFLGFLGGMAAASIYRPPAARAQPKVGRLGVLSQGSTSTHPSPMFRTFRQGLRDLGWVEGQNLAIEWRFSEGSAEPLPRLAAELVGLPVELIVATPTLPTLAAKQATSTIPVVFIQVADPVEAGIVVNLARPGANVTGLSGMGSDLSGKRLELLKEALPGATRVGVLWNRPSQGAALVFRELELASKQLGLELKDAAYGPSLQALYWRGATYVDRCEGARFRAIANAARPCQQSDRVSRQAVCMTQLRRGLI